MLPKAHQGKGCRGRPCTRQRRGSDGAALRAVCVGERRVAPTVGNGMVRAGLIERSRRRGRDERGGEGPRLVRWQLGGTRVCEVPRGTHGGGHGERERGEGGQSAAGECSARGRLPRPPSATSRLPLRYVSGLASSTKKRTTSSFPSEAAMWMARRES